MCVCFAAGWRRSSPTRPSESASEFSSSKTARKLRRSCHATVASPTSRRTTRCWWPASVAKDTPSATFPVSKLPFPSFRSRLFRLTRLKRTQRSISFARISHTLNAKLQISSQYLLGKLLFHIDNESFLS